MVDGLDTLLASSSHPGLFELRSTLSELFGGSQATGRLLAEHALAPRVYRLHFQVNGQAGALVLKCLDPDFARRSQLVTTRWLPAIQASRSSPALLGIAAERTGRCIWHVYEDLGDCVLDERAPHLPHVRVAVELMARIHSRCAEHPMLAECRFWGGDLGIGYYATKIRDAIRTLNALRPPSVELPAEYVRVRDSLLDRLHRLRDEESERTRLMREAGGPETLLHGDLWPKNVLILDDDHGLEARLVDWDRVGVGSVSYDLSTFLARFPPADRRWILEYYQRCVAPSGWQLATGADLNVLLDTAECARLADCVIWPAVAILESQRRSCGWALDELATVHQWFEMVQPVLPA